MVSKVSRELHLNGATSSNDGVSLYGSKDDHDGIVEGTGGLLDVLRGTTSEDNSDGLGLCALGEHVVAFVSELDLFELSTDTEHLAHETVDSGLHDGTSGFAHTVEVLLRDATGTEDISVGEVLGCQVTDRKLREDDLSA